MRRGLLIAGFLVASGTAQASDCVVVNRYIAFEYDGSTHIGAAAQPILKVNEDGTIWVDWPNVEAVLQTAETMGAEHDVARLRALELLRGHGHTLTDAEQDAKELAAGRAMTKSRCAKGNL